jgi:hypothetical protein
MITVHWPKMPNNLIGKIDIIAFAELAGRSYRMDSVVEKDKDAFSWPLVRLRGASMKAQELSVLVRGFVGGSGAVAGTVFAPVTIEPVDPKVPIASAFSIMLWTDVNIDRITTSTQRIDAEGRGTDSPVNTEYCRGARGLAVTGDCVGPWGRASIITVPVTVAAQQSTPFVRVEYRAYLDKSLVAADNVLVNVGS